jgi:phage gp46-like protein
MQEGDVKLFQTDDDGEITVEGGIVEMSGGLETAAYLAMFGGNEDDNGSDGSPLQYWGNLDEEDSDSHYRSETQHLLQSIPSTSGNLKRITEAAKRDLAFFISSGAASSVNVETTIPALNRISIICNITAEGEESEFTFTENWKVSV